MTDAIDRAVACSACDDSGWQRFLCVGDQDCGRRRRHVRHEYVKPCPCRPLNRNFQEAQAHADAKAARPAPMWDDGEKTSRAATAADKRKARKNVNRKLHTNRKKGKGRR